MNFPRDYISSYWLPSVRCSCASPKNEPRVTVFVGLTKQGYDPSLAADIAMDDRYLDRIYAYMTGSADPPLFNLRVARAAYSAIENDGSMPPVQMEVEPIDDASLTILGNAFGLDHTVEFDQFTDEFRSKQDEVRRTRRAQFAPPLPFVSKEVFVASVLYAIQSANEGMRPADLRNRVYTTAELVPVVLNNTYQVLNQTDESIVDYFDQVEDVPEYVRLYWDAYQSYLDKISWQRASIVIDEIVSEYEQTVPLTRRQRTRKIKYCCRRKMLEEARRYLNDTTQLYELYEQEDMTPTPDEAAQVTEKFISGRNIKIMEHDINPDFRPAKRRTYIRANRPTIDRTMREESSSQWMADAVLSVLANMTPKDAQQIDATHNNAATILLLANRLVTAANLIKVRNVLAQRIKSVPRLQRLYSTLRTLAVKCDCMQVEFKSVLGSLRALGLSIESKESDPVLDLLQLPTLLRQYDTGDAQLQEEYVEAFSREPDVYARLESYLQNTSFDDVIATIASLGSS